MGKNTVIKIVSIIACVALVAGIVLLVYLLPRGNNEQEEPTLPIRDEEVVEWGEVPVFNNLTGNGSEETPYLISSENDFQTLAEFFNNNHEASNGYYEITQDITLQNFIPIGGFGDESSFFSGNFNANGKTITIANFDESCKGAKNLGIFAKVKNANIENLTIEGTIISGTKNTGGLAGEAGTINVDSCIFNGKMICAGECTGGIIGAITSGETNTISNCQCNGEFQDDPTNTNPIGIALGGIVGLDLVGADFTDDSNTEDISTTTYLYLGGITGEMSAVYSGTINRCWNSGNLTNAYKINAINCGGIVGAGGTIINCYNTGNITSDGKSGETYCAAGGICGGYNATITNCYNLGIIFAKLSKSLNVGGIGTERSTITNCFNIGNVIGEATETSKIGGVSAGTSGYESTVINSFYLSSCVKNTTYSFGGIDFSDKNSVSGGYTSGTDTLLNKLNAWQAANTSYSSWVTDNATGYPTLSAMARTITLNANGGSCSTSSFYSAPSGTYGTLPTPTRTGYTFAGWWTTASGGTQVSSSTTATASTEIYAHWTANTYTISYTLNNGTAGSSKPTTGTYDTALTISNPTRTGYTFAGWNISGMDSVTHTYGSSTTSATSLNNCKATSFKNLCSTSGTVTFSAQWTPNIYTITLDGQLPTTAGTTVIYEKYNTGYYKESGCTTQISTTANKIDIPTKAGELFGGYFTAVNGGGTQYINKQGFLTTGANTTNFTAAGSLYAYWIHVAGGLGTEINPYLISTAEHLNNIANHVNAGNNCAGQYFKVTADIGTNSSPVSWTLPIGTTAEKPFEGNFDGNNHKITYNYNSSTYQYAGLFGYYTGSTIQNLSVGGTLNNAKTDGYAGGVVAYSKNALTLTNCSSTANVNALTYAGGLIGYANTTTSITNSYNSASVEATSHAGGLIAYANAAILIINNYNTGSVISSSYAGGIIGQGHATTTIINCYSIGSISGFAGYKGGLIGQCDDINVKNSYYSDTCGAGGEGMELTFSNESLFEGSICYLLEKLNSYVVNSSENLGYKYWKVVAGQNGDFPIFSDTLLSYTVSFNLQTGYGGPVRSTYTHHLAFTIPDVAPMKDGCSFVCWNDQANGKGISYYPGYSYILTSNKTLYAIYVEAGGGGDVTIQLCANGGEFANAQEQTIKSRDVGGIVTLERPTRNGFRFLGYNTKADGSGTDITTMKVSEDISLFAQWEPMEYYVKYYDGSTLLKTDTIPANQQKALSSWTAMKTGQTTAEANGWTFHGWATSNSSFERAYENLAIIENITTFGETINLYAIYSKVLTFNYDGNGATSGSVEADKSQTVYLSASRTMSNYSVTLKANEFARTNYHFSKWAFGSATGTQFDVGDSFTQANSSLMWNNDSTFTKTFYAVWAGNSYTINYYNGTTNAGTENYIYGENSTLKTFASLNQTIANQLYGWKFSGWAIANNSITKTFNDGANITNIDIGGSEITQGLTINLYAIYERTIAFHSGKNCATNSTATQTWNPYSTNASNISSVEAPVPTSLQSEHWTTLGYRADQSAGLATYAVQTAKTITPAVDTLNDLYAVYSKEVTITLTDKTTTTTTYYNTSGDQTEITTIS